MDRMDTSFPPITRRQCLQTLGGFGLLAAGVGNVFAAENAGAVHHIPLPLGSAPQLPPPGGMVTGFVRFGWKAFAVGGTGDAVSVLRGLGNEAPRVSDAAHCGLRLTNALDVREDHVIDVATPNGQSIGRFEVRFAGLYQVQDMPLTAVQARAVMAHGAVLKRVSGSSPIWFFAPSPEATPAPDPVQLPHVLIADAGEPSKQFEQRLRGLVMLQGFGWQSGCVSEGILDLAEARKDPGLLPVVDRYQAMYFTPHGVAFESPRSQLYTDRVGGMEEPLPWATLARRQPDHPALEIARTFLMSESVIKNDVSRDHALTTEGCYTVAYPTAVLSRVLNQPELATIALRQLEARRLATIHQGDIYQRGSMGLNESTRLRNWCRGACWYYLGLVRTIEALNDARAVKAWLPEIRRVADFLRQHQRSDGLWGNFIHDRNSVADTSGSAGLAAALARAHAAGWLKDEARQAAQRTLAGLNGHLTPDGLLGGAAQSNKGGDAMQEGNYRVIYQMGMGLKAQLMAAL